MELKKSDYENYDYREFWEENKRAYEDASERLALSKIFKNENKKGVIADIGCGFGRLFNEYEDYDLIIMVDYSLRNLKNAKSLIWDYLKHDQQKFKKVKFVAADATNLPFKDNLIDAAISVRLVHHLNNPNKLISEIRRILKNNSLFIFEFANKRNLKNIIKFFFGKLKLSPFNPTPFMIGETIQDNHPKVIINYLKENNFKISKIISVSNLRIGFLKRKLSLKNLLKLENFFQTLFSFTKLSPSIFIKSFLKKDDKENPNQFYESSPNNLSKNFIDFLVCPKCKSINEKIVLSENEIICNSCNLKFKVYDDIYDLRLL